MSDSFFQSRSKLTLIIFTIALLVRALAVYFFPAIPSSDDSEYFQLARDLFFGHHYVNALGAPTAFRPPGYPFFLSLIFGVFGPHEQPAYWIQAFGGSAFCVLIYSFSSKFLTAKQAFSAGLISALYPTFFWTSRILLTENLALPFLLLSVAISFSLYRNPKWSTSLLLGFTLGLSNLVRSGSLMVAGLLLLALTFLYLKQRLSIMRIARALLPAGLSLALIMGAWAYRNHEQLGKWVMISTNNGITFYASYWPPVVNSKRMWGNVNKPEGMGDPRAISSIPEAEESKLLMDYSIEHLKKEPFRLIRYIPEKILFLMIPVDYDTFPKWGSSSKNYNWFYFILLVPSLLGAVSLFKNQFEIAILLSPIAISVFLQTLIFFGGPRYRAPLEIIMVILTPLGFQVMLNWRGKKA